MNIHVSRLLQKMDEELIKAKSSRTDKELIEKLAVIKSLCEVILETNDSSVPLSSTEVNQAELQKMMGKLTPIREKEHQLASSPHKEPDANGDSIFDF